MIPTPDTDAASLALSWDDDVRGHLRVDSQDERARIEDGLIPAVTDWAESVTGRQLVTRTWLFRFSSFEAAIARARKFCDSDGSRKYAEGTLLVPRPPLQTVTWVKYYDTANVLRTLSSSSYTVSAPSGSKAGPGWILPVPSAAYPPTYSRPDAVEVKSVCGYGPTASSVPGGIRAGMLLMLGELFNVREESVIGTIVQRSNIAAQNLVGGYMVEV